MSIRAHDIRRTAAPPDPTPRSEPGVLRRSIRPDNPTVSVVVPTLNEARNLPFAFSRLPDCVTEVIIVDGHSIDDTTEIAQHLRADVRIIKEERKGKGTALQRGFDEATGDIIVMLDADGSADPAEIRIFVDALVGGADFAKGSRYLPGGGSVDLTVVRSFGNRALTAAVNLVCQTRYTDLCYGYNAFWRDCLEFVPVDVSGFEIETRLNMAVATSGLAVVEVPSHEFCRVHGSSNLHAVRDGLRVLRTIIRSSKEIRIGRRTVRSDQPTDPSSQSGQRRNVFVLAGQAPEWVHDQTRHAAEQMTADGRVLVATTHSRQPVVHLPGSVGGSTLLGVSPTGFPVWTGRRRAVFGIRRAADNNVIVVFDGAAPIAMALAAISGRIRGENVVVQDLRTLAAKQPLGLRLATRAVRAVASSSIESVRTRDDDGVSVALAEVGSDTDFAQLLVDTVGSMSSEVAKRWRIVARTDDLLVEDIIDSSHRRDVIVIEPGRLDPDIIRMSDVVIARHGQDMGLADSAGRCGVQIVLADHPSAPRVTRSFHGEWLVRSDAASILVALECSVGLHAGNGPTGPNAREEALHLVDELRDLAS